MMSQTEREEVERRFADPEAITLNLSGAKVAVPILDRRRRSAALRRRANDFRWTDELIASRAAKAAREMVRRIGTQSTAWSCMYSLKAALTKVWYPTFFSLAFFLK